MLYLSLADGWRVYAGPLAAARGICERIAVVLEERGFTGDAGNGQTGDAGDAGDGQTGDAGDIGGGTAGSAADIGGGTAGVAEAPQDTPQEPVPEAEEEGTAASGEGSNALSGEPEFTTVEDDYFADAVFIGDSRTVGLYEYGGLEETSTFYASTGLTVYKLFDSRIVPVPGQKKKITVEEALQSNSFRKIYLMIGINEMGTGTVETFTEKYREAVERLLELQPDAILYIQAILKVTEERSAQGDYITNEGIEARNAALSGLADNVRVFYLDANSAICDETGGMAADYTFDGVHLKAQYLELWKDFLKTHAICQ